MTRRSQRLTQNSLPFAYARDGLDFDVESYTVDGSAPRDVDLGASRRTLDLSPEDDWETITLSASISVSLDTVERVFPEGERGEPPGRLYVALQCHDTILRTRVTASAAPVRASEYHVDVPLERSELRGEVELHPYLVRTEPRDGDDGYAAARNARVAGGSPFYVHVDASATEDGGLIDGEEVGFADADHLPDGGRLYYLDFRNESRPKLWINSDNSKVAEVLASEGSVGTEPRLRDVVLDQIQYGVWTQLILRTAAALEDGDELEHEWQVTVLESFAPQMYDTEDVDDAAARLRAEATDTSRLGQLAARVDGEVQEYVDPPTQLLKLIEEGMDV